MNAQVEEFINKMKEEEKKKRDNHLISLGLVDKNCVKYSKEYPGEFGWDYDKEKEMFYRHVNGPLQVTDEEYEEILKYAPNIEQEKIYPDTFWANFIKYVANVLLGLNIILGIILMLVFVSDYDTDNIAWLPPVMAILYCVLWYPIIIGFSKIVAVAEQNLKK